MQQVGQDKKSPRLPDKSLAKVGFALCAALLIPMMAVYVLGEIYKSNELEKEMEAVSYQRISPYKEMIEELFRSIDRNTLLFSNSGAIRRMDSHFASGNAVAELRAIYRELSELTAANCCDHSVELYYRQSGFMVSQQTGKSISMRLSDEQWNTYRNMLSAKLNWFVDETASEAGGDPIISFIRPIPSVGNQPQGLIKINFTTSLFQFGIRLPEGQSIWVVTPDGRFAFDLASGDPIHEIEMIRSLKDLPKSIVLRKEDGKTYGYRLFPSPTTEWSFVLRLSSDEFSSTNPVKWIVFTTTLLIMAAAGFYVLQRYTNVTRWVETLLHQEKEIEGKLKELLPILRQHCLQKLLFSASLSDEECSQLMKECGMHGSAYGYAVVLLRIEEYERFLQYSYRDQNLFRFFISKAAEEVAERDHFVVYAYDSGGRDVVLVYVPVKDADSPAELAELLKLQVEQLIVHGLQQYLPFRISAAIGNLMEKANRIYLSCQQAMQTMDDQLFRGNTGVFIWKEQFPDTLQSQKLYRLRRESEQTITKAVLARDANQLRHALETFRNELERLPGASLPIVRHSFWELIMYLYHRVQEVGFRLPEDLKLSDLHARLDHLQSLDAIVQWCHDVSIRLIGELQDTIGQGKVQIINKIIEYMHANFDKEISLNGIADQMRLDPAYLSRTFKQEIGVSFMDYLLTLRIKHAKYLLGKHDMTINEIAEAVGYVNVNSFIRIFKKYESVTPGQYRDLHYPRELDVNRVY